MYHVFFHEYQESSLTNWLFNLSERDPYIITLTRTSNTCFLHLTTNKITKWKDNFILTFFYQYRWLCFHR